MTYRELAKMISHMTEEQKDQDVTVYVSGVGEYYPLIGDYPFVTAAANDTIDEGHYYMVI